ncbi:MAG: hypothetical protein KBC84_07390 [Proteobacteria bacterium]|nr:hypothetical protein [Pseudomonadota bacterium]
MVITLIGFSGAGKSHLSKQFREELSWSTYDCDSLIEQRLKHSIDNGSSSVEKLAFWLGQPYTENFQEREDLLVKLEDEVTADAFLPENIKKENYVIDTSGSVIYVSPKTIKTLKENSTVVYLEFSETEIEMMYQQFLKIPKPIIWGGMFQPKDHETNDDALKRCYYELVAWRKQRYEQIADIRIPITFKERENLTATSILKAIKK